MHLYKQNKKRFNSETGEPLPLEMGIDPKLAICDYTGEEIDLYNDSAEIPLYTIKFRYDHGSEPLWYEDLHELEEDLRVELNYSEFSAFMDSPYHFKNTSAYGCSDRSMDLIMEWSSKTGKRIEGEDNPWIICETVEQAFRIARFRTLKRLLLEKKYTLEQLGLEIA